MLQRFVLSENRKRYYNAPKARHCEAPQGAVAIRFSIVTLPKCTTQEITDCHSQSADWLRNDAFWGRYLRTCNY